MLLSPTLTLTLQCRIFLNPLRKILVLKKLAPLQIIYKFTKKKKKFSLTCNFFLTLPSGLPLLIFFTWLMYVSVHIVSPTRTWNRFTVNTWSNPPWRHFAAHLDDSGKVSWPHGHVHRVQAASGLFRNILDRFFIRWRPTGRWNRIESTLMYFEMSSLAHL
jgi:hypothetical protein